MASDRYTTARFAASAARLASASAAWAGDISDPIKVRSQMNDANPDSVRRYLAAMRERLDIIEQWEAENRRST